MHGILRHMPHIKTRGDVRRLCRAFGIELKGTPMTKHTIEIDLPDHIEPGGQSQIAAMCSSPTNAVHFVMPVLALWQWPEWLTAEWIVETVDGQWVGRELEPHMFNGYTWELSGKIIDLSMTTFTPPPCANWRQSKRRNPRSAK